MLAAGVPQPPGLDAHRATTPLHNAPAALLIKLAIATVSDARSASAVALLSASRASPPMLVLFVVETAMRALSLFCASVSLRR